MKPLIFYIWLDMTGTLDLYQQALKFWSALLEPKKDHE